MWPVLKCKHLLLCAALLAGTCAFGQRVFKGGLNFGGITSQIDGDDYSGFHKFGLHLGGQISVELKDRSALLVELAYSQKGSRNAPDLSDPNSNPTLFRWSLNYIELPVSYQYMIRDKWSAHAGLYWARLINGKQVINGADRDLDGAFTKADIGFQVGGQYHFDDNRYLRLRYSGSAIPMRGDDTDALSSSYWNSGGFNIVLYLAYGFQF